MPLEKGFSNRGREEKMIARRVVVSILQEEGWKTAG